MAGLAAVVAAAVGCVHTQGGAVGLDVAEALAVVALLGLEKKSDLELTQQEPGMHRCLTLCSTGTRAAARLVAWLEENQTRIEKGRTVDIKRRKGLAFYIPGCLPMSSKLAEIPNNSLISTYSYSKDAR